MCGFVGFTAETADNRAIIGAMMDRIIHRGPDSGGVYCGEGVTLGHRRLSIIDLSDDGSQPIFNEDETVAIVFNGEIYNYKALKDELISLGHTFYTKTDTEVLIHLYEQYSYDMLNRLRGMFAFVIYNAKTRELFCARDFFGIKPFYYTVFENDLIFASEIKAMLAFPGFKPRVNEEALAHYLSFQYSVLPETFFKGVYKLMPGHYMVYRAGEISITQYYEVKFDPDHTMSFETAANEIDEAVQGSITAHKVSDVEVGSFLSSGVDSSYVAACFNGDKTFTVGFAYDNYNEISYAQALSEKIKIKNQAETITDDDYWDVLPTVMYHMDEPLADPSAIALYFVSKTAAKYVKVALSGEAADEFFGGYNIYKEPVDLKAFCALPLPLRKFLARAARAVPFSFKGKNFLERASKTAEERFIGNAYIFTKAEREKLLKNNKAYADAPEITKPYYERIKDADDVTKMQYIDIHFWMVGDILLKADKMSMAHSLEVRVPFVDKEVFACASKVPARHRVTKAGTKLAFRAAAHRYLPADVANKKKLGFPVPVRVWLRDEKYYAKVKAAFISPAAEMFFNVNSLIELLDCHKNGKKDVSRKIWTVYIFLVWYERFFGQPPSATS